MSFLKQLLSPFIEFDEKENVQTKAGPPALPANEPKAAKAATSPKPASTPAPKPPVASVPPAPDRQHVQHPLVKDDYGNMLNETPKYDPNGSLTGPLQEHEKYFEDLIEHANRTNPFFAGNDYKE